MKLGKYIRPISGEGDITLFFYGYVPNFMTICEQLLKQMAFYLDHSI